MKKIKNIVLILLFALLAWLSVPFNVLVLGSDARPWQQIKGSRSDAIIVIKVIPLLAKIKMIQYREILIQMFLVKRAEKLTK